MLIHHTAAGIAKVGLDGTLYDQVLDWIFALGLAPSRFSKLSGYDLYFAMARGTEGAVALDMSKFFDTNYHYMVKLLVISGYTSQGAWLRRCLVCTSKCCSCIDCDLPCRSLNSIRVPSPSLTSKAT